MASKSRTSVKVVWKSGHEQVFHCDSFTVSRNAMSGVITQVKWENISPRPLYFALDQVESIIEL